MSGNRGPDQWRDLEKAAHVPHYLYQARNYIHLYLAVNIVSCRAEKMNRRLVFVKRAVNSRSCVNSFNI